MAMLDPHSFADDAQPTTRRLSLDLKIDFDERILSGTATLILDRPAEGTLDLDARGLTILSMKDGEGREVSWSNEVHDDIKGTRVRVALRSSTVHIEYRTSPRASALQWLEPAQTADGASPYVFTQCQPIHARSLFPCQDTPRARVTFDVRIDVPEDTRAVMAAAHVDRQSLPEGRAVERFEMAQPIPTYLFAFAVGAIVSKDIGPRSRVYAEASLLEDAAHEFADVESMITTAESLFGPYDWERFDLLVMPPSFPYGGMENPRLTFLTPTVIAGDRSLVNIVAHELAHSWTGNLVTNATMEDFWLNEGFTTYAERRILEALEGPDSVALHIALGREGLEAEVRRFGRMSPFTRLHTDLEGVDPDRVYSRVPYEKGFLLVLRLEQIVGRERFDVFLKSYITRFRFQSITTQQFRDFLVAELPEAARALDLDEWIEGSGLPQDAPLVRSARLEQTYLQAKAYRGGEPVDPEQAASWNSQLWQLFLNGLPGRVTPEQCGELDARFDLMSSTNAEIRVAFLVLSAHSGYQPAYEPIRRDLMSIGRMKYLRPIYAALVARPMTKPLAREIYEAAKGRYHPVAAAMVEELLTGAQC